MFYVKIVFVALVLSHGTMGLSDNYVNTMVNTTICPVFKAAAPDFDIEDMMNNWYVSHYYSTLRQPFYGQCWKIKYEFIDHDHIRLNMTYVSNSEDTDNYFGTMNFKIKDNSAHWRHWDVANKMSVDLYIIHAKPRSNAVVIHRIRNRFQCEILYLMLSRNRTLTDDTLTDSISRLKSNIGLQRFPVLVQITNTVDYC